jgi:hypothetical protein
VTVKTDKSDQRVTCQPSKTFQKEKFLAKYRDGTGATSSII